MFRIPAFFSKQINWNLQRKSGPRTTLSFRASAHTGVGIPIEFRVTYRHTDRTFYTIFWISSTKSGASNQEIATPVCGLVRNDREFVKFQFSALLLLPDPRFSYYSTISRWNQTAGGSFWEFSDSSSSSGRKYRSKKPPIHTAPRKTNRKDSAAAAIRIQVPICASHPFVYPVRAAFQIRNAFCRARFSPSTSTVSPSENWVSGVTVR